MKLAVVYLQPIHGVHVSLFLKIIYMDFRCFCYLLSSNSFSHTRTSHTHTDMPEICIIFFPFGRPTNTIQYTLNRYNYYRIRKKRHHNNNNAQMLISHNLLPAERDRCRVSASTALAQKKINVILVLLACV